MRNSSTVEIEPDVTRRSIWPLAPNVVRSACSNAESAVSTATLVPFAPDLLIRRSESLTLRHYFVGLLLLPAGADEAWLLAVDCACCAAWV